MTTTAEWVAPEDLADCVDCDETVDLRFICSVAAELADALSGRQFGTRRTVVRPARLVTQDSGFCYGSGYTQYGRHVGEDPWRYAIYLRRPVVTIHSVKLDGATLPTSQYSLSDRHALHRLAPTTKNRMPWPEEQRSDLADTETYTFSIDYTWGVTVPDGGKNAARILACEAAKGLSGECSLPARVVSVVRQGVSFDLSQAQEWFDKGRTGMADVDLWLASVNPKGLRARPSITSPDSIMLNPTPYVAP